MSWTKGDLSASRWASSIRGARTPNPLFSTAPPNFPPRASGTKSASTSPHRRPPATNTPPSHPPTVSRTPGPTISTPNRITTTNPPPANTTLQSRQQSLHLLRRLVPRLKWRASLLLTSLTFATDPDRHGVGLNSAEADVQFRVDFFEFYVLLERVLLGLLGCVGVRVSRFYGSEGLRGRDRDASAAANGKGGGGGLGCDAGKPGGGGGGGGIIGDANVISSSHAFHANLLAALSQKDNNPLYDILGSGQAREYIALAKDLRNGWKESAAADVPVAASPEVGNGHGFGTHQRLNNPDGGQIPDDAAVLEERLKRRYADLLKELKLDEMLRVILVAVEQAKAVAQREVELLALTSSGQEGLGVGVGVGGGATGRPTRVTSVEMTDVMSDTDQGPVESLVGGWERGGDEMEF